MRGRKVKTKKTKAKAKPGDKRLGNKSWQDRTKHGRDRIFDTEDGLKSAWLEYFEWADKNPWIKKDFVRGGNTAGKIIDLPTQRPYTIQGFQDYHNLGHNFIEQFEKALKDKDDEVSKGLSGILSWARNKCYVNKFEGAAVGAFNANVIMRELGLKEKAEVDHTSGGEKITAPVPPLVNVYNVGPPMASDESQIEPRSDESNAS